MLQNLKTHTRLIALVLGLPLLISCDDVSIKAGSLEQVEENQYSSFDLHTILYRSTAVDKGSNLVSGSVILPTAKWKGSGPRPLVAVAPGTRGGGDQCAPSKTIPAGNDNEMFVYDMFLDEGFVVAITDYQGLGTSGTHTYTVAYPSATAVLDVARAAINLPAAGLNKDTPVVLVGYSQGGQAVSKAAEIESNYAPELNIVGVAAGGVPSELIAVGANIDGGLFAGFQSMTAMGLDAAYPELNLESYLTPKGVEVLEEIKQSCTGEVLLVAAGESVETQMTSPPLELPGWEARLKEQQVGLEKPEVPAFLFHGTLDPVIPYTLGTDLRDNWCNLGATVEWESYYLLEHTLTFATAGPQLVEWSKDRAKGIKASNDC